MTTSDVRLQFTVCLPFTHYSHQDDISFKYLVLTVNFLMFTLQSVNRTWIPNNSNLKGEEKLNLKVSLNQRKPSRKGVMKIESEAERALQMYKV